MRRHITVSGSFADIVAEALRRIDFECSHSGNGRIVIESVPAGISEAEVLRRLDRAISAYDLARADIALAGAECAECKEVLDERSLRDVALHSNAHRDDVPHECVINVSSRAKIPESLARAIFDYLRGGDELAMRRLVRELSCFLR